MEGVSSADPRETLRSSLSFSDVFITFPVGERGAEGLTVLRLIVFESFVSDVLENFDRFFRNLLSLALVVVYLPLTMFPSNDVLR